MAKKKPSKELKKGDEVFLITDCPRLTVTSAPDENGMVKVAWREGKATRKGIHHVDQLVIAPSAQSKPAAKPKRGLGPRFSGEGPTFNATPPKFG